MRKNKKRSKKGRDFFFEGCGDHRDLHRVDRRQRQMCIRDRDHKDQVEHANNGAQHQEPITTCFQRNVDGEPIGCLLYTSPSPRDRTRSRMPSSA